MSPVMKEIQKEVDRTEKALETLRRDLDEADANHPAKSVKLKMEITKHVEHLRVINRIKKVMETHEGKK